MAGSELTILEGFQPGSLGRIVEMHGQYYARNWQMGAGFEALVAAGLGAFAQRYDPATDLVLLAVQDGRTIGSVVLDLNDPESGSRGAHLRWFILDDAVRGSGIGKQLLARALAHADTHCGGCCWLTSFAGLEPARHLYEKNGFVLTRSEPGMRWGYQLVDQVFERKPK